MVKVKTLSVCLISLACSLLALQRCTFSGCCGTGRPSWARGTRLPLAATAVGSKAWGVPASPPSGRVLLFANNPDSRLWWRVNASAADSLVFFNNAQPLAHFLSRGVPPEQMTVFLRHHNATHYSGEERLNEFARLQKVIVLGGAIADSTCLQQILELGQFEALGRQSGLFAEAAQRYPPFPMIPSSGYLAFLHYSRRPQPITLVGFSGAGKDCHDFRLERRHFVEGGAAFVL